MQYISLLDPSEFWVSLELLLTFHALIKKPVGLHSSNMFVNDLITTSQPVSLITLCLIWGVCMCVFMFMGGYMEDIYIKVYGDRRLMLAVFFNCSPP